MAMKLLCKVEDTFYISGRGCVIVPAIPEGLDFRIRAKDQIELRTPEGRVLQTHIASVEFAKRQNAPCRMAIMLPVDIAKQDVPTGTEVWLLHER
jgi:translation elongation factor EF-Tu-like GTPase